VTTKAENVFITNRGQRVTKLYEDVNRVYGAQLATSESHAKMSATVFRRMIETKSRGHRPEVGKDVAKCLQYGEGTALKFYRLPEASEVIRRQEKLRMVDQTELFQVDVMAKWVVG